MNENEIREMFHAYRPELSDEQTFLDKLTSRMDQADDQKARAQQTASPSAPATRWMRYAAALAALLIIGLIFHWQTGREELPYRPLPTEYYTAARWNDEPSQDPFDSYYTLVEEIQRSGQQIQQTIAQVKE